ncbi:hypothetical protein HU147_14140 [Planomicrobium chinense]|uniref:hypothetical protein n=1 Tax=Planococcus chinensis TaxID=272917 RepID=UPI001CC72D3A|nr:hypothetical protein [Planococcus chinensis]MBZ5202364.1 hypothetical protein [Planococcus chinensis]MCP2033033.1 hypothetical protein [Planomicrobium sp. HSC-17F08]
MKLLKVLIVLLVVFSLGAVAVYYFGTNMASEKIVNDATEQMESSGKLDEVKNYVENDPELSGYIEEAKAADESSLPFNTTGQATRVLVKKVGMSELNTIRTGVQNGTMTPQEAVQKLEGKLTEEEMLALKVIAYKEIYNQQ